MLVVIYAKTLHRNFIPIIYENFKSSFLRKRKFGNLKKRNERTKAVLRYFQWIIF